MGWFSSACSWVGSKVSSAASYVSEKVSEGLSWAREKAAKACDWIAEEGENFIDKVKDVYKKVKPFLQKVRPWLEAAAKVAPFPWLKVGLMMTAKAIDSLLALENSPVLHALEKAVRKTIKLAQQIKERYLTPEEVEEAKENRDAFMQAEQQYETELSKEQRKALQLNEMLNNYGILKFELREVLEMGVIDFQHYLRLRATQKLLDITEQKIITVTNIDDIHNDDIYLIKIAESLLSTAQLSDEDALKLDGIIQQRFGKSLIPFVFEELMFVWVEKQQTLEQSWSELSKKLSKDRVLKTRLEVAKRTSELTVEENEIYSELLTKMSGEESKLSRLDNERRSMKSYVYAAEGFMQILEKDDATLEAEDKDYLIEDSEEIASIIMRVAQNNTPWESLTSEEQSLITDYANIFEAEGKARAEKLKKEIVVGVAA
ncbi:hypothetical protein PSAR109036_06110 [Psychrobacter arenosus]|uniref:hypothetical protein n=1 Tax=Psychrobacter arenosus TaxID=256326 RepID=UPI001919D2D8|nr:hypothetical protein [Psychrobacter arenosus]